MIWLSLNLLIFTECLEGPLYGVSLECQPYDLVRDGTIDLKDYKYWQSNWWWLSARNDWRQGCCRMIGW